MRTPSDRKGWETLLESPEPPDQQKYAKEYDYQRSLQLGRYKTIGPGVKDEGMRLGACLARAGAHAGLEKTNSDGLDVPLTLPARERSSRWFCCSFKNLKVRFHAVVQDWLFLALLGVIMSILSFVMDYAIVSLQNGQMRLYYLVTPNLPLSALVWIGYVVILTMGSALFAHYMAPQAIGSGIPEMKTILRGVILKEYLSLRTLISKMVGLTLSLGSGLPMGKEGPFVHIASAVASQLSRLVHGSRAVFENESRSEEMLSAGCAVGVACTFSAPIGGVLFSIEVTSVYFAVRNYWRGFFAAICAATLFRVLRMLADSNTTRDVTMAAHFQTDFPWANAYMVQEFPFFAFIGVVGGFFGAFFVFVHRSTVLFLRRNLTAKALFQKFWPIYPLFVSFFISSVTFPMGLGKFIGGEGRFSHSMQEFFSNCTWTADWTHVSACLVPPSFNETVKVGAPDLHHWQGPDLLYDPMLTLAAFQIVYVSFLMGDWDDSGTGIRNLSDSNKYGTSP
ncbi:unnamed protein product [Caenorhabditis auriculariae]|uniref:Chloride channel protein n=1 Tax=Caenorhabditis auriculariae TaxID=2777116 RepID=A0A8S1HQC5_9PELO|nr:unnamed protein product [Caenorhabditis auriculariae]